MQKAAILIVDTNAPDWNVNSAALPREVKRQAATFCSAPVSFSLFFLPLRCRLRGQAVNYMLLSAAEILKLRTFRFVRPASKFSR